MQAVIENLVKNSKNGQFADDNVHIDHIQHFLTSFCESVDDVTEGIVIMVDDEQSHTTVAHWPSAADINIAITNTINMAIKRKSPIKIVPAISSNVKEIACIIASPIIVNQKILGAIALTLNTSNNKITTERLLQLEQKTSTIASTLQKTYTHSRPADANKLIQLQRAFLAQSKTEDALLALANELAHLLMFNRVSIGLIKNRQTVLTAISNNASFIKDHDMAQTISAAMDEASDQLESVIYPPLEHDKPRIHIAHQKLARKTGNAVCCVPLIHNNQTIAVMSFEHQDSANFSSESVLWYEHIANFFTPLISLRIEAEQSWFTRVKNASMDKFHQWKTSESPLPKIISFSAIAMLLGLIFFPVSYHVGAKAHVEGATQRIMAAPVNGYIQKTYFRPGDTVKKGDLLIDLADEDLILEKQKWESEIIQQENNFSGALARQDRTEYAISQAKAAQARAELSLINQELSRSHIVAPMDGIILEGDLTQSLGSPVKLGDHLMTIAPKDAYRLMIHIDERDIKYIQTGQSGTLALTALPTEKLTFIVKRITPVAVVNNGMNTYEVEAHITNQNTYLRPGLQGIAKIKAGSQPLLWQATHNIIDWFKLTIWKWSF